MQGFKHVLDLNFKQTEYSPPDCDTFELQYTFLLKHVSQFRHFCFLIIGLNPLLERVFSYVPTPGHGFWSSILRYFCPHKKIALSKFLMTLLTK